MVKFIVALVAAAISIIFLIWLCYFWRRRVNRRKAELNQPSESSSQTSGPSNQSPVNQPNRLPSYTEVTQNTGSFTEAPPPSYEEAISSINHSDSLFVIVQNTDVGVNRGITSAVT